MRAKVEVSDPMHDKGNAVKPFQNKPRCSRQI